MPEEFPGCAAGLFSPTELRAETKAITPRRPRLARRPARRLHHLRAALGKRRQNPARVQPPPAFLAEDAPPVNLPRLHVTDRRMSAIVHRHARADARAALREVQPHAALAPHAVKF